MKTGIIYFFVIIFANTVGAIAGMGGGVIIKPVMDTLKIHSLVAISFYSSVAVLTMSIFSTLRQLKNKVTLNIRVALLVSIGSIIGGIAGNYTFEQFLYLFKCEQKVQIIQIVITIFTLLFALLYTKGQWKSLNFKNLKWYIIIGMFLGFLATLLGIGGGPINVALLMLCFGMPIKEATVYSIITIFFSQIAKILTIKFSTGFDIFDLSILWFIIPAGILGGFVGAMLSGKLSSKTVFKVYQFIIILVIIINIYNGVVVYI